jgi:hypothetical protein
MNVLKAMDYLGTSPKFLVEGSTSMKSVIGGILSTITTLIIIAGSSYFVNLLLSRSSFNVIQSEEYFPNAFKSWENEELSILVVSKLLDAIPQADRIFDVTGTWWISKQNNTGEGLGYFLEMYDLKLEQCNISRHFRHPELWRDQKLINVSKCLAPDQNFNSSKPFGADSYTGIVLWVHKCLNTSAKNDCLPQNEIDKALENVFVLVRFKDYYFDHKLLGDTSVPYIFSESEQASSTVYKRKWYNFRNVEYTVDEGYVLPSSTVYKSTNLAETKSSVDLRVSTTIPGSFAVVSFNMHSLKQKFQKNYYKCQNMLADLGGLFKGILVIAGLMNYYFSQKLYMRSILFSNSNSLVLDESLINLSRPYTSTGNKNTVFINHASHNAISQQDLSKLNIEKKGESQIENIKFDKFRLNLTNLKENIERNRNPPFFQKTKELDFTLTQIFFPLRCCHSKIVHPQIKEYSRLSKLVENQLEISHIVKKLNNVDVIKYILEGHPNSCIIDNCFNPKNLKANEQVPFECEKMRNYILKIKNFGNDSMQN